MPTISVIGNVYGQLLLKNFLANGSNPLIRRQAIESVGDFDPALAPCADWDFYLRLADRWNFVVVPKLQILYRQSSGSMSSKIEVMKEETLFILEKAFRSASPELQYLKNQSLAFAYEYWAELHLRYSLSHSKDINKAGQNLWMSIRLHPPILLSKKFRKLIKWFMKKSAIYPINLSVNSLTTVAQERK